MNDALISSEGRTFEIPPEHERHQRGLAWSRDRELEIRLHEKVSGVVREHCRVDPTTRNGEPQFPLGRQAGHDFAPEYLSDERAGWTLISWLYEQHQQELRIGIEGRKRDGKYTARITLRARPLEGRAGVNVEADGATWWEALARAADELLVPPELEKCEPYCRMCRGEACRWCMVGFAGGERTCSHRKRRRHMRNPEKEPIGG